MPDFLGAAPVLGAALPLFFALSAATNNWFAERPWPGSRIILIFSCRLKLPLAFPLVFVLWLLRGLPAPVVFLPFPINFQ